jgi:hypothetical protein
MKRTLLCALSLSNAIYCYPPGEPIECELPPGIVYPAEYDVDPDLYLAAELLYCRTGKVETDAIALNITTNGPATRSVNVYHGAQFRPGFKIDAGFGLPCFDNWVIDLGYTWLHYNTTKNETAKANQIITAPIGTTLPSFTASAVHSHLTLHLDMGEINVGRPMYINERMIVNAYFGLKGYRYLQNQSIFYAITNALPGSINTALSEATVWGLGPYGGLDAKGLLWYGIYLVGKFELANQYTVFSKSQQTQDFDFGTTHNHGITYRKGFQGSWPWIDTSIGLGWGTYFGCNYHIDLSATYEMMTTYATPSPGNTFTPREPYTEGVTFKGQLNF